MKNFLLISTLLGLLNFFPTYSSQALAQSTEERFHDLFTTAGYATAFGAALGAAVLSFQKQPEIHLRYVAIGASMGFIGGSVLGTYIIFSPVFSSSQDISTTNILTPTDTTHSQGTILIKPAFKADTFKVASLIGEVVFLKF